MMESFFQSIRCPLQVLLIGDPLARPWAPTNETLRVQGLGPEKEGGVYREIGANGFLKVRADAKSGFGCTYKKFLYLLDGKTVGRDQELYLDMSRISAGLHKLRVIAYSTGLIKNQIFIEKTIAIPGAGKREGRGAESGVDRQKQQ